MNIDQSGTAVAANQTEKSRAAPTRNHAAGADAPNEAGAPSFLSLLTSMGPDAGSATDAGETPADASRAECLPLAPADPSLLLAQNLNRGVGLADLEAAAMPTDAGGDHAMAAATALSGPPARSGGPDAPGPRGAGQAHAIGRGGRAAGAGAAPYFAAQAGNTPSGGAADGLIAQALPHGTDVGRTGSQSLAVASARAAASRSSELRDAAAAAGAPDGAGGRAAFATQTENALAAGSPVTESLGGPPKMAGDTRGDRPLLRPLLASVESVLPGSWADRAFPATSAATGAAFAPDATAHFPASAVAERLSYWMSRGVQNAELQLDAFGGGSVDVSISVHGREALVEFRSDQPEARKLLQDAMPHLRDMLKEEGLELSGGFVGTSARRDQGAQERQNHGQPARQSALVVAPRIVDETATLSRTPGRSVDLFV